ncbi:MAG TPA: BamA/TamA family outer membrane protein [Saprospiraceae bacterium]|nr:BamA/TamA family outer membrane protein [Saprospiraceae bacterium]
MILNFALDKGSIYINYRKAYRLRFSRWVLLSATCFVFFSCNSKKYLTGNQSFLKDNKIILKSKSKIDDKSELILNLTRLYRQNQTKTVIGIPRHVFYYHYQEQLFKNPGRKKWSEERLIKNRPVIHDSTKAALTTVDFEKFLNLRGYRYAKSSFRVKTDDKETSVYYHVDPGPRTYVDSFFIVANDTALIRIIESDQRNSSFTRGAPLDIQLYNKERTRLVNLFQNNGYATFDESFISPLEVDTNAIRVKATLRVANASDSTFHKKYYVGDVTVFPDYHFSDTARLYDTVVRDVKYITPVPVLTLKPEVIERNLFVHKGDLTRKQNLVQSTRNLGKIELMKFVTPNMDFDTISSDTPKVHYTFFLSRYKKIPLFLSTELTYSNIGRTKSLLGVSFNANYRDLNLFKGAEVLNLNFETGVEFFPQALIVEDKRDIINSFNISPGASISFPKFLDPLRIYHIIGNPKSDDEPALMGNKLRKWLLYDATTSLNLNYNYTKITGLYRYNSFNTGLSYVVLPDNQHKLTIERFGFDLFSPTVDPAFESRVLSKSKFQLESFSKQLYTGLLFRNYFYDHNPGKKTSGGHTRLLHNFEISGAEILAINYFTNAISGKKKGYFLGKDDGLRGDTITFSHFLKGEVDFRYFYNFNTRTQFGFRLNTGVAAPFGFTNQVPYLKQFWVGGAQSIRAWQVRELGPGAYIDQFYLDNKDSISAFYQTGDIKLDMSAEMRFHLLWYFDGAVFVDAANVWTLREDSSRPDSQFKLKSFLEQLGIGYGYGIRMDLDYFIIRLDVGYKLYNPYKVIDPLNPGNPASHLLKEELRKFPGGGEIQIGVGLNFD